MSAPTPGPWSWCDQERITGHNSSRVFHEIVTNGKDNQTLVLAEVDGFRPGLDGDPQEWLPEKENDANARLIAAAPEMSSALASAPAIPAGFFGEEWSHDDRLKWMCDYADWWRDVRGPVLAKAEGR